MTQYSGKIIRKNPVTPTQQSASGVWTTADAAAAVKNNNWPVAGVPNPISRSVRLRASASAYVTRTFGNPTNNLKWTYSVWFKKGVMNAGALFSNAGAGNGSVSNTFQYLLLDFNGSQGGQLEWRQVNSVGTITAERQPTMLLRDPSAWYHLVCVWDSANATAGNRMLMYLNGVQITSFTASVDPSSSLQSYINSNGYIHDIGATFLGGSRGSFFDGYLTEINFIDGQALTPSSFGTTDPLSGAWIPMPYTGTYGANGFYLNFKDNTSTTTIGYDYSGNSNNWTANNISLTAGATYDSMVDVPTLWMAYNTAGDTGALVRGNYAVLNALIPALNGNTTTQTYSDGNLQVVTPNTTFAKFGGASSIGVRSDKWYAEVLVSSAGGSNPTYTTVGITGDPWYNATVTNASIGEQDYSVGYYNAGGLIRRNAATVLNTGVTQTPPYTCMVALDVDAGKVYFGINGTWLNSANPAAGTGGFDILAVSSTPTGQYFIGCFASSSGMTATFVANFGQRPFTYTPPTGFKTLNTFNLPAPTINNGALYMAATLYTGNGSTQSISNTVNGISFQPDLVWYKDRSVARDHSLFDSIRGTSQGLSSNLTNAESTYSGVTAFNSGGFSLGNSINGNANTETYVAWQWKAGGSSSSNTSGSITSTVSVNATAGFSVVAYNSGASGDKTVGHGLGVAPSMIITKSRSSASYNWSIYHASVATTVKKYLTFTTGALQDNGINIWGSAFPTSSVFGITSGNGVVASTDCIAYCFSAVAGYSAFGSYTGNGSTDGPFVYTGFRPRFVMVKRTDAGANYWTILDSARDTYNASNHELEPNASAAETTVNTIADFTANGFKVRSTSSDNNINGGTYIYAAFAENPFKYSNAR